MKSFPRIFFYDYLFFRKVHRSSQFLDHVPCGHAAQGVPSSSRVERYVPGGHMSAAYVPSSAQVVPGGQG